MDEVDYIKLNATTELNIIKEQLKRTNRNIKYINCTLLLIFLILVNIIIVTNILYKNLIS